MRKHIARLTPLVRGNDMRKHNTKLTPLITIDNGTELFGDSTPILDANGNVIGKAKDGFDALAQLDTNHDGVVDAQDANFYSLKVWQDLNQDGISQSNKLKTLDELGIAVANDAAYEEAERRVA
jgi:hypothetical protein